MKYVIHPLFAATLSALLMQPCIIQAKPGVHPNISLYAYEVKDPSGESTDGCSGLNNLGQVVADSFVTGPNGKDSRALTPPPGVRYVVAYAINDNGVVVGTGKPDTADGWVAVASGPNAEGFFITPGFTEEMELPAWSGVNNAGQMIGGYQIYVPGNPQYHAIYSDDGGHTWRELLPIGGFPSNSARDLNSLGQVVGRSHLGGYRYYSTNGAGFITDANGINPRMLDVPEGADRVNPYGINDAGQVVANAVRDKEPGVVTTWPYVTEPNAVGANRLRIERPGSPQTEGFPGGVDDQGRTAGKVTIEWHSNHQSRAYVSLPNGQGMDLRDQVVNWPPGFEVFGVPDVNARGQFLMRGSGSGISGGASCYLVCQHEDCDPY